MRHYRLQETLNQSWWVKERRGWSLLRLNLGIVHLLELDILVDLVLKGLGDEDGYDFPHDEEVKTL